MTAETRLHDDDDSSSSAGNGRTGNDESEPASADRASVHGTATDAARPDTARPDTGRSRRVWRRPATDESVETSRLRWWKELIFVWVFYEIYSLVRNQFGSSGSASHGKISPTAVAHAFGHAHDIISIEKSLGLFFEPHLQHWYLGLPAHGIIRFWNVYYASLHFVITIVALVLLYRNARGRYRLWRNVFAATTGLALVGFAAFTLMPPRLLSDSSMYGACHASYQLSCVHYGLVDTLARFGGLWSFGSGTMAAISNQYAAMPSLHIGWSTWCAIVLLPMIKRRWVKALVVLYPLATLFCILVTANHYWIDAVGGLVTLTCGFLVGYVALQLTLRWDERRARRRPALRAEVAS